MEELKRYQSANEASYGQRKGSLKSRSSKKGSRHAEMNQDIQVVFEKEPKACQACRNRQARHAAAAKDPISNQFEKSLNKEIMERKELCE